MFEAVAGILMRLEPAVSVFNAPLQVAMIYMLWRVERRVYGLEILWGVRGAKGDAGE